MDRHDEGNSHFSQFLNAPKNGSSKNWTLARGLNSFSSGHGKVARCLNAVINIRAQNNAGNFLTSWETISFSRKTRLHEVS
jgi:hypothetical protein